MAAKGRALEGALDFLGLSSKKAASYIDRGAGKSAKYLEKAAASVAKGNGAHIRPPMSPAHATANAVRNKAIRSRQIQVGRRYAAGGLALGSVGMYKNKTGSRGGYHGPNMQAPRGSGRFA